MLETIIVVLGIIIDQAVKIWAAGPLYKMGGSLPVIPGVFNFTYLENRGAAFGMLQGKMGLFVVLTTVTIVVLLYCLIKRRKENSILFKISLAMLLSGAVGNFIDRLFLGYVRDMFDFCLINFAVFNVADALLNVGCVILIICILFIDGKEWDKADKAKKAQQQEKAQAIDAFGYAQLSEFDETDDANYDNGNDDNDGDSGDADD